MMINKNFNILITGGTKGLGLAIAKAFSGLGANVYITHRWESREKEDIISDFEKDNLPTPSVFVSNVGDSDDVSLLMQSVKEQTDHLDAIVSNVAFAQIIEQFSDLKKNSLNLSLDYSAWPMVSLTQQYFDTFGKYPRYVIGVSSDGPDVCHPHYDLAGCSKAVLETLCKYMALRLREHHVCVNCIRPGFLDTESALNTFGKEKLNVIKEKCPEMFLDPNQVAKSILALCSGWMDTVSGQIITVDDAWSLQSPIYYLTAGVNHLEKK